MIRVGRTDVKQSDGVGDVSRVLLDPARQRGFVVGRLFAGAFLTAGFCADRFACARVRDLAAAAFFFAAGFLPAVVEAPDVTRDECFVRWRTVFFGAAASAIDDRANAATSATTNIFIVLRSMQRPPEAGLIEAGCEYDNAFVTD
jgi:hypothetical protein